MYRWEQNIALAASRCRSWVISTTSTTWLSRIISSSLTHCARCWRLNFLKWQMNKPTKWRLMHTMSIATRVMWKDYRSTSTLILSMDSTSMWTMPIPMHNRNRATNGRFSTAVSRMHLRYRQVIAALGASTACRLMSMADYNRKPIMRLTRMHRAMGCGISIPHTPSRWLAIWP